MHIRRGNIFVETLTFSIIEGTSRICFNHKERDFTILLERKIERKKERKKDREKQKTVIICTC